MKHVWFLLLGLGLAPGDAQAEDVCFATNPACFVTLDGPETGMWEYQAGPPQMAPAEALPYVCLETDLRFDESGALHHPKQDRNAQKCTRKVGDGLQWKTYLNDRSNKTELRVYAGNHQRDYIARFLRDDSGTARLRLSTIVPELRTESEVLDYLWRPASDR